MRQIFVLFLMLVSLLAYTSCSKDEESKPVTVVTEDYLPYGFADVCEIIGLNKDLFYEESGAVTTFEDKIVLAAVRKADNKLFVTVYDEAKKVVLFQNTDFSVEVSFKRNYYEDIYTYKLQRVIPVLCTTEEGFIIVANAQYNAEEASVSKFYNYAFFNDGKTTRTEKFETDCFISPEKWFKNSCLLCKGGGSGCMCYTDKGEQILAGGTIRNIDSSVPISYTEYICFGDAYNFRITKRNLNSALSVWETELNIVENQSESMKTTYSIINKSENMWIVQCKAVSMDGSTQNVQFNLNIDTGDYTIL